MVSFKVISGLELYLTWTLSPSGLHPAKADYSPQCSASAACLTSALDNECLVVVRYMVEAEGNRYGTHGTSFIETVFLSGSAKGQTRRNGEDALFRGNCGSDTVHRIIAR